MNQQPRRWIGALLLPLPWNVLAAEPPSNATGPPATEDGATAPETATTPAATFDLRSSSVRDVVRNSAASQGTLDYRIEAAKPARSDADIAAALRVERPVVKKTPAPRLPERPPPCDGFFSCGIETLFGLEDFDDETYGRVERTRLMNRGSFTDSSKINSSVGLPLPPGVAQEAGAPHRP